MTEAPNGGSDLRPPLMDFGSRLSSFFGVPPVRHSVWILLFVYAIFFSITVYDVTGIWRIYLYNNDGVIVMELDADEFDVLPKIVVCFKGQNTSTAGGITLANGLGPEAYSSNYSASEPLVENYIEYALLTMMNRTTSGFSVSNEWDRVAFNHLRCQTDPRGVLAIGGQDLPCSSYLKLVNVSRSATDAIAAAFFGSYRVVVQSVVVENTICTETATKTNSNLDLGEVFNRQINSGDYSIYECSLVDFVINPSKVKPLYKTDAIDAQAKQVVYMRYETTIRVEDTRAESKCRNGGRAICVAECLCQSALSKYGCVPYTCGNFMNISIDFPYCTDGGTGSLQTGTIGSDSCRVSCRDVQACQLDANQWSVTYDAVPTASATPAPLVIDIQQAAKSIILFRKVNKKSLRDTIIDSFLSAIFYMGGNCSGFVLSIYVLFYRPSAQQMASVAPTA